MVFAPSRPNTDNKNIQQMSLSGLITIDFEWLCQWVDPRAELFATFIPNTQNYVYRRMSVEYGRRISSALGKCCNVLNNNAECLTSIASAMVMFGQWFHVLKNKVEYGEGSSVRKRSFDSFLNMNHQSLQTISGILRSNYGDGNENVTTQ